MESFELAPSSEIPASISSIIVTTRSAQHYYCEGNISDIIVKTRFPKLLSGHVLLSIIIVKARFPTLLLRQDFRHYFEHKIFDIKSKVLPSIMGHHHSIAPQYLK